MLTKPIFESNSKAVVKSSQMTRRPAEAVGINFRMDRARSIIQLEMVWEEVVRQPVKGRFAADSGLRRDVQNPSDFLETIRSLQRSSDQASRSHPLGPVSPLLMLIALHKLVRNVIPSSSLEIAKKARTKIFATTSFSCIRCSSEPETSFTLFPLSSRRSSWW